MSSTRSSASSKPTDRRIRESLIPKTLRCSAGTEAWVINDLMKRKDEKNEFKINEIQFLEKKIWKIENVKIFKMINKLKMTKKIENAKKFKNSEKIGNAEKISIFV